MDEMEKTLQMWKMGFGNPEAGPDTRRVEPRTLRSDWKTLPMPLERTEIDLVLPLSASEFETLSLGHRPHAMEDHWFMYFDGEALCFHRSWTGICIYQMHVRHAGDAFEIFGVTANRDPGQYGETSDERDRLMASILVADLLGHDSGELWDAWSALDAGTAAKGRADVTPIGFWAEDEAYGFYSNWYPKGFSLFGLTFHTSEHWMMWQKARVMGDLDAADLILQAPSPKRAKKLGGKVKPYDHKLWSDVREDLVAIGVREKFLQNPDLARELLATGNAILAEASPLDKVWGVGIASDAPGFADLTGWKGDNLLGRVLMRVRADLRMLMRAGSYHLSRVTLEEETEYVISSNVGAQSLLALTRNPVTRPQAFTFARIAQSNAKDQYPNVHDFLMKVGLTTVADLNHIINQGANGGLTSVGWRELLIQLAFLRRTGAI